MNTKQLLLIISSTIPFDVLADVEILKRMSESNSNYQAQAEFNMDSNDLHLGGYKNTANNGFVYTSLGTSRSASLGYGYTLGGKLTPYIQVNNYETPAKSSAQNVTMSILYGGDITEWFNLFGGIDGTIEIQGENHHTVGFFLGSNLDLGMGIKLVGRFASVNTLDAEPIKPTPMSEGIRHESSAHYLTVIRDFILSKSFEWGQPYIQYSYSDHQGDYEINNYTESQIITGFAYVF
ncbi:hypothetical protein VCHA50P417_30113 [Vibrio chagasii]|nr:hypothetical protein VCHA50P417_30113 [Vibrio chagasii]